ncbi:MAG: integrase, partial [Xanthobacteraceae bacterium]
MEAKDKTIASYEHVLNRHIKPVLGTFPMHELARAEVYRLHASLAATPYMANYVVTVLSSLYSWAGRRGLVTDDYNPARRIEKFREQPRERFLNAEEFSRLGAALREAETVGIPYDVD